MHLCPEGCVLYDGQYDFPSSEHHYQFSQLHFHGKVDESYRVLEETSGFHTMKLAHQVLPEHETKPEWKEHAVAEMLKSNELKYQSCPHARQSLIESKLIVAEAMIDHFWGSGFPLDMTRTTLSDYWPGKNNLGKILVRIREELRSDTPVCDKWKAESPLESVSKTVKV